MNSTPLERVRPAAVAGRFYPREPLELRRLVESLLAQAPPAPSPAPKALIAPHAGYLFSGAIAASAYAQLRAARDTLTRVVLLGPSHFLPFRGLAASSASAFATPLGLVPVDAEAVSRLCALPQINILDEAHTCEHALEVQLPFLQVVLNHFCIVPVLVGDADPQTIDQAIETLWGGPETCVVVSSDLSHYLDSQHARQLDEATAAAIIAGKPEDIGPNQACGRLPLRGLLVAARHHHLRARLLDLRNSGDTTGPRDRVVGYGAFALEAEPPG